MFLGNYIKILEYFFILEFKVFIFNITYFSFLKSQNIYIYIYIITI